MFSSSKKFAWTLIGVLLLAGTAFCQATVSILSGNGQIVLQNSVGSNPLGVVVRDAAGNPVANAKVVWTISGGQNQTDRKSTRLNSSHSQISYAVFCLKKKKHYLLRHDSDQCDS